MAPPSQLVPPASQFDEIIDTAHLTKALRDSDFFVGACPLSPETRGRTGVAEVAVLPVTAYEVNVARGPIIDEHALINALSWGHLGSRGPVLRNLKRSINGQPPAQRGRRVPRLVLARSCAAFGGLCVCEASQTRRRPRERYPIPPVRRRTTTTMRRIVSMVRVYPAKSTRTIVMPPSAP
jgi:D-isomer specific 2-hydroxyacid dehydrogenase, NAD binding domain